jgi:hypothetical protein
MAQAGLPPVPPGQESSDGEEGDGEDDPDVGSPPPGYVRPGGAVVPVRDNSTPSPATSPGVM